MIEISNDLKTGHTRKAKVRNIFLDDENLSIIVNYKISHSNSEGENIDAEVNTKKLNYVIKTHDTRDIDPETDTRVLPDLSLVDETGKGSVYPEGLITEYEMYSSLGWDYVLSINPEATKVVLDGNYGVAYALLLRDDALGLV